MPIPYIGLLAEGANASPFSIWPSLLLIMLLFYFMLIRPERSKQKAHRSLLASLRKNDRVVTAGGIYGVVTNVQRDSDEVTIRVDESTNVRIRITVASVARVIREDSGEANSDNK